jgi:LCT (Lysosomal Cystine Transporter) family transporter
MYWSAAILQRHHELNPGDGGSPVHLNDVVFSIHAVTLTAITIIQCLIYDRGTQQLLSWTARIIVTGCVIAIIVLTSLSLANVLEWYFFLQSLGFIKLGMSTIKYVPQAWMNFRRKSTVGWSIGNIILDFSGGCLSILQMVIDSINTGDWSAFYSNIPKFALGQLSMVFAVIFMVQHYCLYRHKPDPIPVLEETPFEQEEKSLLKEV